MEYYEAEDSPPEAFSQFKGGNNWGMDGWVEEIGGHSDQLTYRASSRNTPGVHSW